MVVRLTSFGVGEQMSLREKQGQYHGIERQKQWIDSQHPPSDLILPAVYS
jgi:hypothetical protein